MKRRNFLNETRNNHAVFLTKTRNFLNKTRNFCRNKKISFSSPQLFNLIQNRDRSRKYSGDLQVIYLALKIHFPETKKSNQYGWIFYLCSENRDRTCDLRVMSPTSYRCSISRCGCKSTRYKLTHQTYYCSKR